MWENVTLKCRVCGARVEATIKSKYCQGPVLRRCPHQDCRGIMDIVGG